jgi:hypothetical protein
MTRDGGTLDHGTLETIRTMAVARGREGERPSEVIARYGFPPVYHLSLAQGSTRPRQRAQGTGVAPASGRPRTLTAKQERQVFRWVNGKNPRSTDSISGCGPGTSCVN